MIDNQLRVNAFVNVSLVPSVGGSSEASFRPTSVDTLSHIKTAEKGVLSRILESCTAFFKKLFCYLCSSKKKALPSKEISSKDKGFITNVSSMPKVNKEDYKVVLPQKSEAQPDPLFHTGSSGGGSSEKEIVDGGRMLLSIGMYKKCQFVIKNIENEDCEIDVKTTWDNYIKATEDDPSERQTWLRNTAFILFAWFNVRNKNFSFGLNKASLGEKDTVIVDEGEKRYVFSIENDPYKKFILNLMSHIETIKTIYNDLKEKLNIDKSKTGWEVYRSTFSTPTFSNVPNSISPPVDIIKSKDKLVIITDKLYPIQTMKLDVEKGLVIISWTTKEGETGQREIDIRKELKKYPPPHIKEFKNLLGECGQIIVVAETVH